MHHAVPASLLISSIALALGCVADPVESGSTAASEGPLFIDACVTGWCLEATPGGATPLLHGVWAVDASTVFAVGDGGAIYRRASEGWSQMASGTTANLRGVWAASASDVWAVGLGGTLLHFDGAAWTQITGVTTSDLDAVWGSATNNVWFCGSSAVLRWDGTRYTSTGFTGTLLSVSGTGPNDVWVTGENTNLHHFTGTEWITVNPGAGTTSLLEVLALATNDVWVTSFVPTKETLHFTGGKSWVAQKTSSAIFNSLAARSASEIWGVGGNRVGRWNGTVWSSEQPFGANVTLWSVTIAGGHAWLVGGAGLIAHRAL